MNIKKHRILTLLSLMMCGISLMAQIQLTGVVKNSKTDSPIEFASAVLLKPDSTVVRGTTTDSVGRFKLNVPAVGEYLLKVSYIGYQPSVKSVAFATDSTLLDMGIVTMISTDNTLKTAVVTGTAARVEQKEDTTVFNASAYRTPEGSSLEALVKQFPGVEVSEDGKITWNGKEVKELLVNGKDFFKGDKDVAMKNLPVDMVNRIKAYEKQSDYSEMTGIDDGEEMPVLDIITKRQLNESWVTNLDLAYGTENRYSAKVFATRFTDRSSITAYGALNNVGDRGFGGPMGFGGGGQGLTATKNAGLNASWENSKAKKEAGRVELNGSVRYVHTSTDLIRTSATETFLNSNRGASFSNSYSKSDNSSTRVNVNARLRWLPDTMTTVTLRPSYSYSSGRNSSTSRTATFKDDPYAIEGIENPLDSIFAPTINPELAGILVNKNLRDNMGDNASHNVGLNLNIVRRIGSKGRNVSLRARGNYSQSENNSYSVSDIQYGQNSAGKSQFQAQRSISPSQSYDYNIRVGYTEPIVKNLFAEANYTYSFRYNNSDRTRDLLEQAVLDTMIQQSAIIGMLPTMADSTMWAHDLYNSQYATYRYYNHTANIGLRYSSPTITANAGVDFNPERTKMQYNRPAQIDTTIVRTVFNVAPQLRFRYKFSKTTNLDIRYRGSSSQPSMTNLLGVVDDSDPLNISMGNAGLKPSWNNNLRVFYHGYNPEQQRGIVAGVDMTQTKNSISNLMIYDENTGVRYTRPENINGNWNARGNFMFNTGLGEKKLFNISTNTNVSYANSVGYVNSTDAISLPQRPTPADYDRLFANAASTNAKSITRTVGVGENLNASYRTSWFDVGLLGTLNYQHSQSTLQTYNNMDTWNFAYGANANFNFDFGLSLSTDIRMNSRRGYADQAMNTNELLWNAQISYAFLKNRSAVVMLQAYDILRQQSNVSRVINAMQRSDSWTNAINSYFMIHFVYKLNIFSGGKGGNSKGDQQQGPGQMPGGMGRGQMPAGHPPVGGMPRGALYQAPTIYTR